MTEPVLQGRMEAEHICVVMPTYNNCGTLAGVIDDVLCYTTSLIVVNDGSTDQTAKILEAYSDRITIVSYLVNRGKGFALKRGFSAAVESGYHSAITLDSDGQHFARDLERFVEMAEQYPGSLLMGQRTTEGTMPSQNSFANKFSNFWFTLQTAKKLNDTQNGFRLYPLKAMKGMRPYSYRYEAELELLVRSAWKGIPIYPVPVHVYYAPEGERVTHFRPGKDFFRISLLNTLFVFLAVLYGYPSMLWHKIKTPLAPKGENKTLNP